MLTEIIPATRDAISSSLCRLTRARLDDSKEDKLEEAVFSALVSCAIRGSTVASVAFPLDAKESADKA